MEIISQSTPQASEPTVNENHELTVCNYAEEVFLNSAVAMNSEIDGVRKGRDIEYLHRMRVASRRLRTALEVFSDCLPAKKKVEWRVQVKQVTQALGETRDTDVQILLLENLYEHLPDPSYRTGMRRLVLRLRQKRVKLQKGVLEALDLLEKKKVLIQIEDKFTNEANEPNGKKRFSYELYKLAFESISKRLDEFLSYEIYLQRPEFIKELHQMRIAAKRLRYALEIFAPLFDDKLEIPIKSSRQAQQILGEIHDCDVWLLGLPQFVEKEKIRIKRYLGHTRPLTLLLPGILYFQRNRQEERANRFRQFQQTWQKWRRVELWLNLKQNLLSAMIPNGDQAPVNPSPL